MPPAASSAPPASCGAAAHRRDIVTRVHRSLDLQEALTQCGVEGDYSSYAGVAVRVVPRWLERVWGSGVDAMTLPGVVYVSPRAREQVDAGEAGRLLVHEAAHVDQWRSLGMARFLVRYLGDYLRGRAVGLPHHAAYRAIRFERDARARAGRL